MAHMSGADPEALDRLGIKLERAGVRLRAQSQRLGRSLESAPWHGGNADRFRQDYRSVHMRAINDAARFLDEAYETLIRNADEQRSASSSPSRSAFRRIMMLLERGTYWMDRFPWIPRLPSLDRPSTWAFPRLPRMPWLIPHWPMPWRPGFRLPDIRPIRPADWIDDVLIGLGIAGTTVGGIVGGRTATQPQPLPKQGQPSNPAPRPETPAPAPLVQGPHQFSQDRLVAVATGFIGQTRPALDAHGNSWNQPGQCIKWVDSWLESAGLPGGLPGGDAPFAQLEKLGGVRVDGNLQPGDVFQRASATGWGTSPHTAVVKSFDLTTGKVVLIEGNVPMNSGTVREHSYTLAELNRPGNEVRFYRLGRVG